MNRVYYEALRKLPDRFVSDHTKVTQYGEAIIVTNPDHEPMLYSTEAGEWMAVELQVVPSQFINNPQIH
jgi:hypothetical protein